MIPRLLRIAATISAYVSDEVTVSYKPEEGERIAVIGTSCDSQAALLDHEVLKMVQGQFNAVSKSTVDGVDYGVHLGAICNFEQFHDLSSEPIATRKFQPWPGRVNDPHDYAELLAKTATGQPLTVAETNRLMLARSIPCESFAVWALQPGVEWCSTFKRIRGSTAITKFYLYAVVIPEDYDLDELNDRPHWLGQALILGNTAQVEDSNTIMRWSGKSLPNMALRMKQIFGIGHSNNGGTIVYALDHFHSVLVKLLDHDGTNLLPHFASRRVPLYELCSQILQHQDCSKDPGVIMLWNSSIQFEIESTAVDFQKDIRLAFYGLIRPQDSKTKRVLDVA